MKIIKTKKSPNYSRHPDGKPKQHVKTAVMMHSTVGNFSGALSWLCMSPEKRQRLTGKKSYSSAHMLDDRDNPGVINQLIPFSYRSWHGGGVTRRTERAMKVIGVRDPNNVTIGYEFVNYYDINHDGKKTSDEMNPTESQLKDFVDFMFYLEEKSKTDPFLDIRADEEHLLTHRDTNHHKPNMEKAFKTVVRMMKERRGEIEEVEECSVDNFTINELIDGIIRKIRK